MVDQVDFPGTLLPEKTSIPTETLQEVEHYQVARQHTDLLVAIYQALEWEGAVNDFPGNGSNSTAYMHHALLLTEALTWLGLSDHAFEHIMQGLVRSDFIDATPFNDDRISAWDLVSCYLFWLEDMSYFAEQTATRFVRPQLGAVQQFCTSYLYLNRLAYEPFRPYEVENYNVEG